MAAHLRWASPAPAPLSLLCLPYAGGDSATFRTWPARLGPRVRVGWAELPGRGEHFAMNPLRRIADQVHWLLPEVRAVPPPLAIFGYSMGALIGFELAHALREVGATPPSLLMVAAHNPPGEPKRKEALHALPDAEFLKRLAGFNGMPSEVLGHAELLALLLPRLRADFEACETYSVPARPPLDVPLVVYGGVRDPEVPPEGLLHWAPLSRAALSCVLFSGHHFFLHDAAEALLRDIDQQLQRHRTPRSLQSPDAAR